VNKTHHILICAVVLAASAAVCSAGDFLEAESRVLGGGASALPSLQEIGGDDIGGVRTESFGGPSHLGERLKAGALSLLLPGLGQLYNGDRRKAVLFGGVEAGVWTSYLVLHTIARHAEDDYEEYAGLFAGTAGEHSELYWRSVGRYMSSDEYNMEQIMRARAEDVEPSGLISEADAWFWRNEGYREDYKVLRADANRAYDRRDFTMLFAILNRAISVFDAVRGAGGDHMIEVSGLGFDLANRRVLGRASTACVVSGSF
jgi:hypothetical protein